MLFSDHSVGMDGENELDGGMVRCRKEILRRWTDGEMRRWENGEMKDRWRGR